MNAEQVKELLKRYGFTVNEKQTKAIVEIFEKTTLGESDQIKVLEKYAKEALVGVINIEVENNVNLDDAV